MKLKYLLPVLLLLFINACDQGEDPQPIIPPTDPLLGLTTKSVQVKLPEGSHADIAEMTVYSNEVESRPEPARFFPLRKTPLLPISSTRTTTCCLPDWWDRGNRNCPLRRQPNFCFTTPLPCPLRMIS